MKTLKIGSKGDEVVLLQKKLGIEADGIFGKITEAAVIAYQKSKSLDADGIVGAKTWAALGVASDSKCVDPSVVYAPLKSCITHTPNRDIKYLVYHYTAGGSSAPGRAVSMKNSWEKTKRASADFGIDDSTIVQFNPDLKNYSCWHCGDKLNPYSGGGKYYGKATNRNSIGVEICSNLRPGYDHTKVNHEGWYFTKEELDNAIKLGKILMKKYNIPIERVLRHYDVSGKVCPGLQHWNDAKGNDSSSWENFKNRLK